MKFAGAGWYLLIPHRRRRPSDKVHYVVSAEPQQSNMLLLWGRTACGVDMTVALRLDNDGRLMREELPAGKDFCKSCMRSMD